MAHKKRSRHPASDRLSELTLAHVSELTLAHVSELALERLPEALVLLDDDRRYVGANEAACALFGLPREEVLARRADDVVAAPATELDAIWTSLLTSGTVEGVVAVRHPREGVVRVDYRARANVAPGVHVSVLRRISDDASTAPRPDSFTELLTMQEALLAPDASLDSVMHLICERATVVTGAEGATIEMQEGDELVYRVASGTMAPFSGFRLARDSSLSGLALTTARVLVCEDSENDDRVNREACRRVGARSMVLVPLVHGRQVVGVLKVTSSRPHAFDAGVVELLRLVAGFLGTAISHAEAQDMRSALQRAERERVVELERLRAELSSLVVHDLRSPLASVMMNLQYLRDEMPASSSDAVEAATDALAATKRLDHLINLLLEMARLESKQMPVARQRIAVAGLVGELVAEHARRAAERGVRLAQRADSADVVSVDVTLVRRALNNILDNALRYVPDGGVIELTSRRTPEGHELRIGNSGDAIPVEERERVFEKFAHGERRGRASFGLGLYFCRLVVEAHGGTIWIESSDALPTIFVMRLPLGDPRES